jgi:protease IV
MRQFLKFTLATMTGFLLTIVVLIILSTAIIGVLVSSGDKEVTVAENSVLHLDFSSPIQDRGSENPFEGLDPFTMQSTNANSFSDYVRSIEAATKDEKIKGIFLDLKGVDADLAIRQEIFEALKKFKESDKFIYAYSETYTQGDYHLAALADSIFLYPTGDFMFTGYASEPLFFKGMLDKLGVEVKLIRVGKYKGAGEPFIRENLSEENRFQIQSYLNSLYKSYLDDIADARKISADTLWAIANELRIETPEQAVSSGLIDGLAYRDEVLELLKTKTNAKSIDKIKFISVDDYASSLTKEKATEKSRIAVVYAIGDIISGEGDDQTIGSDRISEALRDARLDKNVKAVVLRVNSPGGSALASDVIWREMVLLKKAKKPVVVSMGALAASGGYYISIAADSIFAEPTTITGSIGVFGLLPNISPFMKDKLGLTFDRVTTGKYADIGTATRSMRADEEAIIQRMVNRIYEDFTNKVAEARNLPIDSVQNMAQGRVYTGAQAKTLGLVDELGNLDDAIATAARMANLKNYRLKELPSQKNPIDELIKGFTSAQAKSIEKELGLPFYEWKAVKTILENDRIQARMEFIPSL